ncbi:MAG: phenylacetate--CoA ligase family protein [Candidatus Hydrogenedentes bacterium]|nr:phenylacetate--CoA ligase family protein [Candidatus Hydrogenedentota bacterium]
MAEWAARTHAWATGSRLFACWRELEAAERLSADELQALSNRRLRETLRYAYAHVPYYRRVFDERGLVPDDIASAADLPLLPVLTKRIIRDEYAALHADPQPPDAYESSTGGSTGEALKFRATRELHDWHNAAKLRAWKWAGYRMGTPLALLWGSPYDVAKFRSLKGRLRRLCNRERLLSAHALSDAICEQYVERMRRTGVRRTGVRGTGVRRSNVRALHGYAGAVYALARLCLNKGIDDIRLDFVLTTAETVFDYRRAAIEEAFGCRVFDHYGSRETSMVSQECGEHGGYHVSIDNGIIEIVRDGQPVGPGETGSVLVTGFHNRAMPLIRYEIGDVAVAADKPCGCSLPFPTFKSVEGRVSDMIVLRDGRVISPMFVIGLLFPNPEGNWGGGSEELDHVDQYQVVQEDYDAFTVRLVLKDGYPLERYRYIEGNLQRSLAPGIRVRLEQAESIAPTDSGKRRPVMSRVPSPL